MTRLKEKLMAAAALRKEVFESQAGSGSRPSARSTPACPIDLVHLARQTMGDRALEVELLALFDRQAGQIAARLATLNAGPVEARPGENWRADLAHKLKGSARAVGAHAVATAADNYEHCARAGVLRPSDAEQLVAAVAEARAALRDLAS
jgi:HPt (histidine-containing phosphotransfer) domain-containing protein